MEVADRAIIAELEVAAAGGDVLGMLVVLCCWCYGVAELFRYLPQDGKIKQR